MARLAIGLVHWPVVDRAGKVVATSITNYDIHDIARAARTYGVERYYLIHPMKEQQIFVSRILDHWRVGEGAKFNPMRKTALLDVYTTSTIDEALSDWNGHAKLVATSARNFPDKNISFSDLRAKLKCSVMKSKDERLTQGIEEDAECYFLLFGTGFGLTQETLDRCNYILEPIKGSSKDDYRHLSVRSAVSICLDRLLSTC